MRPYLLIGFCMPFLWIPIINSNASAYDLDNDLDYISPAELHSQHRNKNTSNDYTKNNDMQFGFASTPDCMPIPFAKTECPVGSVRSSGITAFELKINN